MPTDPTITAFVYSDSSAADEALRQLAIELTERGLRLAGLVQLNQARPGARAATWCWRRSQAELASRSRRIEDHMRAAARWT